ncbi:MAG: glutamine-synthetase adenylyltransferase, partial [Pararhodobacter sp.]|nr:glutamine-synthetase adenylyltransferase [Pararhodobacter sp.]
RPGGAGFDARAGAGRLQDIELMAQMGALMAASPARRTEAQLLAARRAGVIDATQEETLVRSYRLLWRLHAAMRLLGQGGGGDAATLPGQGATSFVLRETGEADEAALQARLAEGAQAAEAVIAALLPAVSDGGA